MVLPGVFVLAVLWVVESFEPNVMKLFTLTITAKNPDRLKPNIERIFRRNRADFELRTTTPDEICYEVRLPHDRRTETVSDQLLALEAIGIGWEGKEDK